MARRLGVGLAMVAVLATLCLRALEAQAPANGVVGPALTPEQVKASEELAAKLDESAARERERLSVFKGRPFGSVIQRTFNVYSNYILVAAQMMPEADYGFHPTPEVRVFGEQINHSTVSHYSFCNQAGMPPGIQRKASPPLGQLKTKAVIVSALKDSIAYCNSVLAAASESWLMEIAPAVGGSSSGLVEGIRAHAFLYNNAHDAEDYGTITTYLRLRGLVPPSSATHPAAPATRP
jgi:hypothetical protein